MLVQDMEVGEDGIFGQNLHTHQAREKISLVYKWRFLESCTGFCCERCASGFEMYFSRMPSTFFTFFYLIFGCGNHRALSLSNVKILATVFFFFFHEGI